MNKIIKQAAGHYGLSGEVKLVGNTGTYLNLFPGGITTLEIPTVRALRDALNEFLGETVPAPFPATKAKRRPNGPQAYKGNGEHEWERVSNLTGGDLTKWGGGSTVRLRVPGGWLYNVCNGIGQDYNTVFVPLAEVIGYDI